MVYTSRRGAHHQQWCTHKVVYTISSGVHPKWSTPRGVVHTTSSGPHPRLPTPRGVVHTISSLKVLQQCPNLIPLLRSNLSPSAHDYLTNLSILCPYSRRYSWLGGILQFYLGDNNAYVSIIWFIIHFQQTQSVIQIASHKPSQIISNFLRSRHFGPSVNHHGQSGKEPYP